MVGTNQQKQKPNIRFIYFYYAPEKPAVPDIAEPVMLGTWTKTPIGYHRSYGEIKEIEGFDLFIRRTPLNQYIDDFCSKSSKRKSANIDKHCPEATGSSTYMGIPELVLTPPGSVSDTVPADTNNVSVCGSADETDVKQLPVLSSFDQFESLRAIRSDEACLQIGYDSEWETDEITGDRDMISWQFGVIDGADIVEFVFIRTGTDILDFSVAIGCILDHINAVKPLDIRKHRKYEYCTCLTNDKPVVSVTDDINEARSLCKYAYQKGFGFTRQLIKNSNNDGKMLSYHQFIDYGGVDRFRIAIVCHANKGDLTGINFGKFNILKHLTEVQGGLVTVSPDRVRYECRSLQNANNTMMYALSISFVDTLCHAPAKRRKLADLGDAIGIEKIDLPDGSKNHMREFFKENPVLFMEYASRDSVVTLLYTAALYGYNRVIPATITGVTARVMRDTMSDYLGCGNKTEFDLKYRGIQKISHGMVKRDGKAGFIDNTSWEPISDAVDRVQHYCSNAYHGGYNICCEVGYFPQNTYDYDLRNAYPTAMCLVPDIDWDDPIKQTVSEQYMDLSMFMDDGVINPIKPFVGYVRFRFPDYIQYPCIPVTVDGVPVYPLSSDGMDGVYAPGPLIWLALRLGAEVYCKCGYFLNPLKRSDGSESRSMACAVKQLVADRNRAKIECVKNSLDEMILKTMVCSGYGKNAQNVIEKSTWSAYSNSMESMTCSCITNPFSAMMTTAIVQAELIAVQNQIFVQGYMSCSGTTDGLISDCPEPVMKTLDLFGLRPVIESSRLFLTDGADSEIWEMKHRQTDLVNFTTRGNVSLSDYGVCAHAGIVSGYEPDSYDDRRWLMTQAVSRTGRVESVSQVWTPFRDLVAGKPFRVTPEIDHKRMDFDMKRKPSRNNFTSDIVVIDGKSYEIAHFTTIPFNNVQEFKNFRQKLESCTVLRTENDWAEFWQKIDLDGCKSQPRDIKWSTLNSCIMGHRAGLWDIPGLANKSVAEKCAWINTHNDSGKKFTENDWKNARRPDRQANMLPREIIQDKLNELMSSD